MKRLHPAIAIIAGFTAVAHVDGQIRTPIATEPVLNTTPGPAPYNAKAVVNSPSSITVSWDAVSGARAYTVMRKRTDDPSCCVVNSGLITTPSWTDGALEFGQEYSFVISALYFDGRTGTTEVVMATPMPQITSVKTFRNVDMASSEGILRGTPCTASSASGPPPAATYFGKGTPAGASFSWATVPGAGMNYVVDRAPEGTTNWVFIGSTCGGPSPIYCGPDTCQMRDFAGGIPASSPNYVMKYVYRVTAVGSNGSAGWNTYHFTVPCLEAPRPTATVTGNSVTLQWGSGGSCPFGITAAGPDTYTLTSSFGFTKTSSTVWNKETIYGVPVGTHTFTMVGNYRTGGQTRPTSIQVVVAY